MSIGVLIDTINKSESGISGKAPKVLLLAPPPLGKLTAFSETFTGGIEKSKKIGKYYKSIAEERGTNFFDLGSIVKTSDVDGVHLSEESHRIVGEKVAEIIRNII